jgi:hypothetical protein
VPAAQRERREQRGAAGQGEDRNQRAERLHAVDTCADQHAPGFEDAVVVEHERAAQHRS